MQPDSVEQKGILATLQGFQKIETVLTTPLNALYYTEGIDTMARTCHAWRTIFHIKPILDILIDDTEGVLYVTLEGIDTGGTRISYRNSDGYEFDKEVYLKETFLLNKLEVLYIQGTLMLTNEYSSEWFSNG